MAVIAPVRQLSLDDLGTPLTDVTFVVLDVETTGGAPEDGGITEIGAVKVRGGEVLGEFHTLVNPGEPIPAFIAALTGISNAMIARAPRLEDVLPKLLNFLAGSVLVAHNAPYDVGFLKGACARTHMEWPAPAVLDTLTLARQALTNDEVPNRKLGTLAQYFRATTSPTHRALDDARATVDVMHGLIERVGNLGTRTLEELQQYCGRVPESNRRKRGLADDLPEEPGVYVFQDSQGRALYVGTSKSIRTRVRTYFTASEKRTRMGEMVALATRVTPIVCATPLEAAVREIRIIAEMKPPYNKRSTYPERAVWLKLTAERFPRLSVTRSVADDASMGAAYIGPFRGRPAAEAAAEAVTADIPLRTCTDKIGLKPTRAAPCLQGSMGKCPAPCVAAISPDDYGEIADLVRTAMQQEIGLIATPAASRMADLAAQERFEEAASWRDRLNAFATGAHKSQRSAMLAANPNLVAARATKDMGWDVHVIRYGRLAGSCHVPSRMDPSPYLEAVTAAAECVDQPIAPATAALPEETALILNWLESPGVRLIASEVPLALPAGGAGRLLDALSRARDAQPNYPDLSDHR